MLAGQAKQDPALGRLVWMYLTIRGETAITIEQPPQCGLRIYLHDRLTWHFLAILSSRFGFLLFLVFLVFLVFLALLTLLALHWLGWPL